MKKNRYLLCILLCGVLLYYGVPRLAPYDAGIAGVFSVTWLAFAIFVLAGNLTALLYAPKAKQQNSRKTIHQLQKKRKIRYFQ
jgi:hypothetical protein